jgi:radical SAM superfamily enzyme YgiQ (UPF0313 family)
VESGNKEILSTIKKKITPERTREAVKMSKEAGITPLASFIIGLPGETRETLQETVDFARSLETDYGFHLLAPFPGTEVREKAEEYRIKILTHDWLRYDANQAIIETEGITCEELNDIDRDYWNTIDSWFEEQEELERLGKIDKIGSECLKIKRHDDIVSNLIQRDIIENMGLLEKDGDEIECLAAKLSHEIPYPLGYVRKEIADMVNNGILKYRVDNGNVAWKWG